MIFVYFCIIFCLKSRTKYYIETPYSPYLRLTMEKYIIRFKKIYEEKNPEKNNDMVFDSFFFEPDTTDQKNEYKIRNEQSNYVVRKENSDTNVVASLSNIMDFDIWTIDNSKNGLYEISQGENCFTVGSWDSLNQGFCLGVEKCSYEKNQLFKITEVLEKNGENDRTFKLKNYKEIDQESDKSKKSFFCNDKNLDRKNEEITKKSNFENNKTADFEYKDVKNNYNRKSSLEAETKARKDNDANSPAKNKKVKYFGENSQEIDKNNSFKKINIAENNSRSYETPVPSQKMLSKQENYTQK